MPRIISPSVLSADFGHLADDIAMLDRSEAEWIHIDVMDGVFVPNISFGFPVMGPIRQGTKKVLDTHLMIVNPEKYVERFVRAGAGHRHDPPRGDRGRARRDRHDQKGRRQGRGVDQAEDAVAAVVPYLNELDLVLVMSVEPGFGGQSFIEGSTEKVAELRREIDRCGSRAVIEIDGGITLANAAEVYAAGCEVLVAGSTVFASENPEATIHELLNV